VGRLGCVDDIVLTAVHLCTPDAAFITGQVVVIDGGAKTLFNTPYAKGFFPEGARRD